MRVVTDVALRYCPALDRFVKVRLFTADETERLLGEARFESRRGYLHFLLNLCLPEYPSTLSAALERGETCSSDRRTAEEALYQVCVELNPHLEITRVTIPVPPDQGSSLYLLEASPRTEASPPAADRYLKMEERLEQRVIGQPHAIRKLARVLRRAAAGLRDPQRPVGSFFFLGQTGVGKTELAKALAAELYDGEGLVRVDCSEYALPHEYAKLIGAPPGYIGHQEGGTLTDALRARGASVVLFDEIEKAHPKVHQLLLQVLDEGVLTDSQGHTASFREAVLIMTSNVGAREVDDLDRRVGFGVETRAEEAEAESLKALRSCFPPEFVNRIDEVVVFKALGREEALRICNLLLEEVARYLEPKGLAITFSDDAVAFLVDEGVDSRMGARPLRRTIQRRVLDPLAELILGGSLGASRHIQTRLGDGALRFEAA